MLYKDNASDLQNGGDFVRGHTRAQQPPLVPEVTLFLADDVMHLWEALGDQRGNSVGIPFWGCAWVGGQALARYVLDHPEEVEGKRVLDLATGSGLCGIAAALGGADRVVAADVDPLARIALALNAEENAVHIEIVGRDLLSTEPPDVDVILAGDVCYEQEMAEGVLPWLQAAHREGARVLIGDPGRHYFPREITSLLASYDVPTTWAVEGVEQKRTGVYAFSGPGSQDRRH